MNNDIAIEVVFKHFFLKWLIKKRTSRRLRCLKHIINFVIKAFLYNKEVDAFEKDIELFKEKSDLLKELTVRVGTYSRLRYDYSELTGRAYGP